MKRVLLVGSTIFLMAGTANAAIILSEDFEDANVAYTTLVPEFTDGSGDFFTRTDGSNIGSFVEYSGIQGSSYFAAMDTNGDGGPAPVSLTFSNINIAGYTNLSFSALFAEDDDGANEDWDNNDYFKVEYRIDGGEYQNLLAFENNGDTYNSAPYQDTDFDGIGDGMELTNIFTLFSSNIADTGDALDIRFTFQLEAGDEDIAIDNVLIEGVSDVPVPGAIWLLGSGLVGLAGLRRKKR